MNPEQQSPSPQPVTQPQEVTAQQQQPVPTTTPSQMYTDPQPVGASAPSNKRMPLIIGLIVGLLVVLVGAFLLWLFVFSPAAQSKKASNAFMKAATTGDKTTLVKLGDAENDASAKSFLEKSSDSVLGKFVLKQTTSKNGKWYFLYDLTNTTNKHARTIVEKQKSMWIVTSLVYGKSELALIPGSSSSTPDTSTPTAVTPKAAAPDSQVACLQDSDLTTLNNAKPEDKGFGTTFEEDGYRQFVGATYFFKPDSVALTYPEIDNNNLDKVKLFYQANKSKEFTIHLSGKVQETTSSSSGVKLSHDRAAKIRAELVSRGIPTSLIIEDEPQQNSATYNDGSERNVDLNVRKKVPCATTSATGR